MRNRLCVRTYPFPVAAGLAALAASLTALSFATLPACANDGWDPFGQLENKPVPKRKAEPAATDPSRPPLAAMDDRVRDDANPGPRRTYPPNGPPTAPEGWGQDQIARETLQPPVAENARGVERGELTPVIASDGTGLPYELWRGLDVNQVGGIISKLEIPPRSNAIHALWQRLITSKVSPPAGVANDGTFEAIRAEALYRSGLLDDAATVATSDQAALTSNPTLALIAARIAIGQGKAEAGCERAKFALSRKADLPQPLQGELLILSGYCAAVNGKPAGAGLAAELARETKGTDPLAIAALDAIAAGQQASVGKAGPVSLLVYRLVEQSGATIGVESAPRGEPALLATLATSAADPALKLAAAEAAIRLNAISPSVLASVYRETNQAAGAPSRANLFKTAEAERTPLKKVRAIRTALDDAKRAGLYWPMLIAVAPTTQDLQPAPEISWFAQTGIEIALATGNLARARQWAALDEVGQRHWLALIDLADPTLGATKRDANLAGLEEALARGRLPADLLQKLATVLDATDTNVPIPLWEAASKAPQTTAGFLPETGVLSELQDAAKKKEFGRTVLLVMRATGRLGPEGANSIALGDSIRALRRAGLEPDARRMALEALFAQWPRSAGS